MMVRSLLADLDLAIRLDVHGDGEEILTYLKDLEDNTEPCPDLVLLDLNIPKSSGTEVLHWIRKSTRCGKLPVVLLTSSQSPKDRELAEQLGVSHYFCKPTDLDEYMKLGSIVTEVLSQIGRRVED